MLPLVAIVVDVINVLLQLCKPKSRVEQNSVSTTFLAELAAFSGMTIQRMLASVADAKMKTAQMEVTHKGHANRHDHKTRRKKPYIRKGCTMESNQNITNRLCRTHAH